MRSLSALDSVGRRTLGAVLLLLVLAALPRLCRFDSLGEGTDEAYSVMATRAMVEGRFSYAELDDFTADGYQAKFTPVAEAVAVPFVLVLGDRPLAYRLPSLLATLATLALVAFALSRRFGPRAVLVVGALALLDYRSVVYAQTHRYVAIEQALLVGTFLLALRAERTRRWAPALGAGALALLAFHAHFLALLVLAPLGAWLVARAFSRRAGERRPAPYLFPLVLVAVEAVVVLVLFRRVASAGLFGETGLAEGGKRAALSTARMLGGLGPLAAGLGLLFAIGLVRRPAARGRALAAVVLGGTLLFALGCLRWDLRPRYGVALQPFFWLAAADGVLRWQERFRPSAAWRSTTLATVVVASWTPGLRYLATAGGRDAEDRAIAVLRQKAKPGDGVVYDAGFQDPFRRRPPEYPAFPLARLSAPDAIEALSAANVRWVWTSSAEPPRDLYATEAWQRRVGPEALSIWVPGYAQETRRISLHRFLPAGGTR